MKDFDLIYNKLTVTFMYSKRYIILYILLLVVEVSFILYIYLVLNLDILLVEKVLQRDELSLESTRERYTKSQFQKKYKQLN